MLEVTPAEAGQKLLQFLQRRLNLPQTLLHRWVRTGQIRRNGGRCKPFEHVVCGDMVRLPPFALAMHQSALEEAAVSLGMDRGRQSMAGGRPTADIASPTAPDSPPSPSRPASAGKLPTPARPVNADTPPPSATTAVEHNPAPAPVKFCEAPPYAHGPGHPRTGTRTEARPEAHTPNACAPSVSASARTGARIETHSPSRSQAAPASPALPLPPLVYADEQLMVFNKPAGLPVHPGTGHSDALTTRLAQHCASYPFLPTPAHRLDKDTSGLLLVASAYGTLRALQDAFRQRHMVKEYVAWVMGLWPHDEPRVLRHHLAKAYVGSHEKVRVREFSAGFVTAETPLADLSPAAHGTHDGKGGHGTKEAHGAKDAKDAKEAVCIAHCLRREPDERQPGTGHSLMHIRLITGRTHQIRAQLAAVGHPLCGDFKYGTPDTDACPRHGGYGRYAKNCPRPLYLHSLRIILPDVPELATLPREFTALPPWQGRMVLRELPPPLTVPSS